MPTRRHSEDMLAVDTLIHALAQPLRPAGAGTARASRPDHANRRRAPRVELPASDAVITIAREQVRVVDLSPNGLQVLTAARFTPGQSVLVHIRWHDEERPSAALGRAVWSMFERPAAAPAPYHRVGVVLEQFDSRRFRLVAARYSPESAGTTLEVVDEGWQIPRGRDSLAVVLPRHAFL